MKYSGKKRLRFVLMCTGMGIGIIVLAVLFNGINTSHYLIRCNYYQEKNSPRLLLVFTETGYSEDHGNYLNGYQVKIVNPEKNEVLDESFIDRFSYETLPTPNLCFVAQDNIWLVQPRRFIQGDTGFIARLQVVNDKIIQIPSTTTRGYIMESLWGKEYAVMKNSYNETSCLDFKTGFVSQGNCPPLGPAGYETFKSTFITAPKEQGSTRARIYYFENPNEPVLGISVGSGGNQSLLYRLWFSTSVMPEPQLETYKKNFSPSEKLTLLTSDYLVNPYQIYSDKEVAVFGVNDDAQKQTTFYCFGKNGETRWKINDKELYFERISTNPYASVTCDLKTDVFVLSCSQWVFAVDVYTGRVKWKYIP